MSAASKKGYGAEHAMELLEQERGLMVWRPRAGAPRDRGDIGGLPLVQSVKNRGELKLSTWVGEMESMVVHAGVRTGVVIHKRRGKGPMDWYVTTNVRLWLPVLDILAANLNEDFVR